MIHIDRLLLLSYSLQDLRDQFGIIILRSLTVMNQNKKTLKDDIETVERNILIISWFGIFSAIGIILYSLTSV